MKDYGEIPISKIHYWVNKYKIQDEENFEYLIRSLDSKFLELSYKQKE